ncbi:hypothetical protein NC651_009832 [Populus alba x Populus x berolinensis]|nr:hypothetical protein NC651_009832 [Populus alba x Populus x berolinensis]
MLMDSSSDNNSYSPCCASPETPTSVLPEFTGSPASGRIFKNFYRLFSSSQISEEFKHLKTLNPMGHLKTSLISTFAFKTGNSTIGSQFETERTEWMMKTKTEVEAKRPASHC